MGHNTSTKSKSNPPQSESSSISQSNSTSYAKEIAAYQSAVYDNPQPSHAILHSAQYSTDIKSTYANSIAVLTTFWKNNINTLSDNEYAALALMFYLNAYANMCDMPQAHHILKKHITNSASHQSKIFFGAFGYLVNEISQPDAGNILIRKLSILGRLHQQMGVVLPYYLQMGAAFHKTMADKFKENYTLRVRFCFNTLYEIVVYIMLGLDFRSKCHRQKDKIAAFMKHINDVQSCLNDADTLEYLTLFMKQRLCDELALFYKDYKAYKCCVNQKEREAKGQQMIRLYINALSEREINISGDRRKEFHDHLMYNGFDNKLFDAISEDVKRLIEDNCFAAFKKEISRVYEETDADDSKSVSSEPAYSQNWNFLMNRLHQTGDVED